MKKENIKYYLAGSISLITFIIYLSALQNHFVEWDDNFYVFENPHIRFLDLSFFRWAFFDFYAGNWHPLTWISHAFDYAIWGLSPFGHHLTNNLFHAVNTFAVVLLVLRIMEAARKPAVRNDSLSFFSRREELIAAGVTGALFGLHPVHVESVAWVAERKDLLCTLFFALSIIAYLKYVGDLRQKPARTKLALRFCSRQYLISLGFFVLALLSKPMAVTLPLVLLILDYYPLERMKSLKSSMPVLAEKALFVVLSLASSALTILAQKAGGAMASMEARPLSARLLVGPHSLIAYLLKMILPLHLSPFYPYPKDISLSSPKYLLAIVVVAGITLACIAIAKKQKLYLSAWAYYVITLFPVIGIVQVGSQSMADRYTYLPSLGPFLLAGLGAAWLARKIHKAREWGLTLRLLGTVAAVFIFASMSFLTVKQIGIWKDSINLWSYAIERDPSVSLFYYNRGYAFERKGQLDEAIADFDKAVTISPDDYRAYINRGIIFHQKGRLGEAITDLEKAKALNSSYYKVYIRLGLLYVEAGLLDKAIENFTGAIARDPGEYTAYNNRGFAYLGNRQYERALADFNRAVALNPDYALAYFNRGNLYLKTGNHDLAISDFQRACDLKNGEGCNAAETLRQRQ